MSKRNREAVDDCPSPCPRAINRKRLPQFSLAPKRPIVVLRKFPGPAGVLLPEHRANEVIERENDGKLRTQHEYVCTPQSPNESITWRRMTRDFCVPSSTGLVLPVKYNVAWIVAMSVANRLVKRKAPFLAAIIKSIEHDNKLNAAVVKMVLGDATGQIEGMIVHELYEEHANVLTQGSVVVLRQFGVLSTPHSMRHYLTITNNNLVAIYSSSSSTDTMTDVRVVLLQPLTPHDFVRDIAQVKSLYEAELLRGSDENTWHYVNYADRNLQKEQSPRTIYRRSSLPNSRSVSPRHLKKSENETPQGFDLKTVKSHCQKKFNSGPIFSAKTLSNGVVSSNCAVHDKSVEENHLLQSIFEGIDTNSLFEDF